MKKPLTACSKTLPIAICLVLSIFPTRYVQAVETKQCPESFQIEPGKVYSRKEAYQASEGRIVFHYGAGVRDADIEAYSIERDERIPALALPGGPPEAVEIFVGKGGIIKHKFSQHELLGGVAGDNAVKLYKNKYGSASCSRK